MQKLLKLKVWITIVLLSCSTSLYANNTSGSAHFPSTGDCDNLKDSVLIAYDDLRIVNSKLLELDYQKQINTKLRSVIHNDSIVINDYKAITNRVNKDYKKAIRQRNIAIGAGILFFITSIILLVK